MDTDGRDESTTEQTEDTEREEGRRKRERGPADHVNDADKPIDPYAIQKMDSTRVASSAQNYLAEKTRCRHAVVRKNKEETESHHGEHGEHGEGSEDGVGGAAEAVRKAEEKATVTYSPGGAAEARSLRIGPGE